MGVNCFTHTHTHTPSSPSLHTHQDDEAEESDEEGGGRTAAGVAGLKVKVGAEDLAAGETLVMTLEDKPILDEHGNLLEDEEDVVENVLMVGCPATPPSPLYLPLNPVLNPGLFP